MSLPRRHARTRQRSARPLHPHRRTISAQPSVPAVSVFPWWLRCGYGSLSLQVPVLRSSRSAAVPVL